MSRAASCSSPLLATALPPSQPSTPSTRGEAPAGLAHDRHQGGHVVEVQLGLGRDVHGALGDQHVGPEVPVRAGAPERVGQLDEVLPLPAFLPARPARSRTARRPRAWRRRRPAAGGPRTSTCRCRHPCPSRPTSAGPAPGRRPARPPALVLDQRDQRGPDGHAAHEVLGAVDRVDHPVAVRLAGGAEFLAGDGVARPGARQVRADRFLGGLVRVGDRGQVRLGLHHAGPRP